MSRPRYTRYALRLRPEAAASAEAAASRRPVGAPARPEPEDDWSGVPAAPAGDDPQALEYRHPDAAAAVLELQPHGWQEDDDGETLVFWLPDGAEADARVAQALRWLGALGRLEVSPEAPGWEDAWQRFHKPQVVGRLHVRPPWYPARDDLLDVAIEAGMAFGTGGHATTRQCLELIQTISPGSLLDLGCGSGVVSLAALRLGFTPVWGIDIDPVAVRAADGNAALNDLAPSFVVGDATDPACALPEADTVVANIAFRPILRLAGRWAGVAPAGAAGLAGAGARAQLEPPRHLLLSGLLVEQGEAAAAAFPWCEVAGRRDDGAWLTLHLVRRT